MTITPQIIRRRHDETDCDGCNQPLRVGSVVLCHRSEVYCSEQCARDSRPTEAPPAISSQGVYAPAMTR